MQHDARTCDVVAHVRVYASGDTFSNVNTGSKKERVPRLVRMHADEMEEIDEVKCDAPHP